jgi:hypothetical protein
MYERLREQVLEAEAVADEGFRSGAERMMARFDKKLERVKKRKRSS